MKLAKESTSMIKEMIVIGLIDHAISMGKEKLMVKRMILDMLKELERREQSEPSLHRRTRKLL